MLSVNPKFVLREWMLVKAYRELASGPISEVFDLYELIQRPYEEGTELQNRKYYRSTPDDAVMAAGTAFMSWSS